MVIKHPNGRNSVANESAGDAVGKISCEYREFEAIAID